MKCSTNFITALALQSSIAILRTKVIITVIKFGFN